MMCNITKVHNETSAWGRKYSLIVFDRLYLFIINIYGNQIVRYQHLFVSPSLKLNKSFKECLVAGMATKLAF